MTSLNSSPKIIIINPNRYEMLPVAPLGLEYLCNALDYEKIDFDILDLTFKKEPHEELKTFLGSNNYDFIGITIRNIDTATVRQNMFFLPIYKEYIDIIRGATSKPIILGGAGFSCNPVKIFEYFQADYGVIGYGEMVLPNLLKNLKENRPVESIPNLIYKNKNKICKTSIMEKTTPHIPISKRKYIDNLKYYKYAYTANVQTKRGCSEKCNYCLEANTSIYERPVNEVLGEMEELQKMGVTRCFITDSEFNVPNIKGAVRICKEIIKNDINMNFVTQMIPKHFTESFVELLKAANFKFLFLTVESASDRILKTYRKSYNRNDIKNSIELLEKHGISYYPTMLVGSPDERVEDVKNSLEFMETIVSGRIGVNYAIRIYDNTEMAQKYRKKDVNLPDLFEPVYTDRYHPKITDYLLKKVANNPKYGGWANAFKEGMGIA